MTPITFHPRHYVRRPWTPLTRAEFDELTRWLPGLRENERRRGRRLDDPRRTINAIFWMACSRGPWRELPPELGKADTAHRMLRRWAKAGALDQLVRALSSHPFAGASKLLRSMGYWICRAWRRMARVVPLGSVRLVRDIQVVTAWPAPEIRLPNWRHAAVRWVTRALVEIFSTTAQALRQLARGGGGHGTLAGLVPVPALVGAARATLRVLRRWLASANGNRGEWRTK
jgi:transposase